MPPNSSWLMIANGQQPTDSRNTTPFEKRAEFGRHDGQTIRRCDLIKGTTPVATRRDDGPRPTPVEALKAFTYNRCSVNGPCPLRTEKMMDTTSHRMGPHNCIASLEPVVAHRANLITPDHRMTILRGPQSRYAFNGLLIKIAATTAMFHQKIGRAHV